MKGLIIAVVVVFLAGVTSVSFAGGGLDPIGYPYFSWGEISQGWGDKGLEEGLLVEGYVEQGIDWFEKNDWVFNTFIGLRFNFSSESEDYWNNRVGPWIGIKASHPFWSPGWGSVSLGLRGELYEYTTSAGPNNDSRITAFFQWSFGGDWKKK